MDMLKKTEYEIMCELEGMSHLLRTYPEEFPNLPSGRLADKLAAQLQMSKSTIGEYRTIANNLGEKWHAGIPVWKSEKNVLRWKWQPCQKRSRKNYWRRGSQIIRRLSSIKKAREEVKEVPNFETSSMYSL